MEWKIRILSKLKALLWDKSKINVKSVVVTSKFSTSGEQRYQKVGKKSNGFNTCQS